MSTIIHGDCLTEMAKLEANSVDSIVTDPPYHLTTGKRGGSGEASVNLTSPYGRARITTGFMGKQWDGGDVAHDPETWRQALRVAKPGAHLLAFGGTRTFHRLAVAIEDAGWEIRDTVMWVYGSGFPKSHNLHEEWEGWGTALKPAWEPIIVARKTLDGTVAENVQKWGTGAINIDGCRIGTNAGWSYPNGRGGSEPHHMERGERNGIALRPSEATSGRWPANLIHDGSEEVLELFPRSAGAFAPVKRGHDGKSKGIYGDFGQKGDDGASFRGDSGSAARFFYCAKASKHDRDDGLDQEEDKILARSRQAQAEAKRGNVVESESGAYNKARTRKNNHPTVKPTDLMRYLCRLVTPPNGLILDPFCGSGSTGKGAILEGFRFIGIEKDAEYVEIARIRSKAI